MGAMVGAGIFSLLGPAGEVAGAAVWLSFMIAGFIAFLQGYSFAKLGSRFPSGSGMIEYVSRGFGPGHFTGMSAWLVYATNIIVTSMVAVSFGAYASSMFTGSNATWAKVFAVVIILAMGTLNVIGSGAVAKVQGMIVRVVIGILVFFSIVTLANVDWSLLAFSGYPSMRQIVSSVALTFFAFLGFGVITFTAKDLSEPRARTAAGDVHRPLDRRGRLHRDLARRVRHVDRQRGHRLRRNRTGRGREADARQRRVLADGRHRVVRDRGRDELGHLSHGRAQQGPRGQETVPAGARPELWAGCRSVSGSWSSRPCS